MIYILLNVYLTLIVIRPQDFVTFVKGMPVLFVLMLIIGVMWLVSDIDKKIKTNIDKYFISFFIVMLLSTALTLYLGYFVGVMFDVLKLAIFYMLTVTIINNKRKFVFSLHLLVLNISLVAFMAILQQYGYDITGIGMYWASDKQVWQIRGVGIFDNPNDLAYSVLPAVSLSFAFLLFDKRFVVKLLSLIVFLLSSYSVYLTYSRGGLLAFLTLLAVIVNYYMSNIVLKKILIVASVCFLFIAFSLKSADYRNDESSMGRVEAWVAGMDMLKHNPVFGVGKGMFTDNYSRDSHNSYVRVGAELGLVGFYIFIGILYWCIRSLNLIFNTSESLQDKTYAVALLSYIFAFIVGSLFSTRTYDIMFIIIVAFASILVRNVKLAEGKIAYNMLFAEKYFNGMVFACTLISIISWKIFLIQTW